MKNMPKLTEVFQIAEATPEQEEERSKKILIGVMKKVKDVVKVIKPRVELIKHWDPKLRKQVDIKRRLPTIVGEEFPDAAKSFANEVRDAAAKALFPLKSERDRDALFDVALKGFWKTAKDLGLGVTGTPDNPSEADKQLKLQREQLIDIISAIQIRVDEYGMDGFMMNPGAKKAEPKNKPFNQIKGMKFDPETEKSDEDFADIIKAGDY